MAMALLKKMRKQNAVYWSPKTGATAYDKHGQRQWNTGVQLKVRWQLEENEVQKPDGERVMTQNKVFAGEDIALGGVMWLGLLAAADDSNPLQNSGAGIVMKFANIPTLRNDDNVRIAYL
jgi:hypothetical protein